MEKRIFNILPEKPFYKELQRHINRYNNPELKHVIDEAARSACIDALCILDISNTSEDPGITIKSELIRLGSEVFPVFKENREASYPAILDFLKSDRVNLLKMLYTSKADNYYSCTLLCETDHDRHKYSTDRVITIGRLNFVANVLHIDLIEYIDRVTNEFYDTLLKYNFDKGANHIKLKKIYPKIKAGTYYDELTYPSLGRTLKTRSVGDELLYVYNDTYHSLIISDKYSCDLENNMFIVIIDGEYRRKSIIMSPITVHDDKIILIAPSMFGDIPKTLSNLIGVGDEIALNQKFLDKDFQIKNNIYVLAFKNSR